MDAVVPPGGVVHGVDVAGDLRRGGQAPGYAVQPRRQTDRHRQIGVAGGVGRAQLHPGGLAPGGGNADQGGAVGGRPGPIAGGLVAAAQPLVGVDQGVGYRREALDMVQNAGDEGVGRLGQLPLPVGVVKYIFAVLEQGHVQVHPVPGDVVDGLGHEGGVQAVLLGHALGGQPEGHDLVRTVYGPGVLEVDLVLAGGVLMVAGFDLKAHLLQIQADLPAGGFAVVQRAQVEVARLVLGAGGGPAVLVRLKEEKFQLRPDVELIKAHGVGPAQRPAQHPPGVPHKGRAVGVVHVAEHAGHPAPGHLRRQDKEAVQVGVQALVRLVDAGEALDGGAVKHDLVVHRLLHLGGGDGHVLHLAENVGELHPDELDLLLPDQADDVFLGIGHGQNLLSSDFVCRLYKYRISQPVLSRNFIDKSAGFR